MAIKQNIKVAVDAVVFGYQEEELKILLIKQRFGSLKNQWCLPGGFVKTNESLKDAVKRELKEEAGITVNFMEQLYTFGDDVSRDHRGHVISVSYFALVNPKKLKPTASTDALDVAWFSQSDLPKLGFDHKNILKTALRRLQSKVNYQPIGFELLDPFFPFSDLEKLYQTILGRQIDRRNFRKKILSFGFIEPTERVSKSKDQGRPAKLFRFNRRKYKELERSGITFEISFA